MEYLYTLKNNVVSVLMPNDIHASQEEITEYGLAHGGKKLIETTKPCKFYNVLFVEDEATITQTWIPINIEEARSQQKSLIIAHSNKLYLSLINKYSLPEKDAAMTKNPYAISVMSEIREITEEQQVIELDVALKQSGIISGCLAGYNIKLEHQIDACTTLEEITEIIWDEQYALSLISYYSTKMIV